MQFNHYNFRSKIQCNLDPESLDLITTSRTDTDTLTSLISIERLHFTTRFIKPNFPVSLGNIYDIRNEQSYVCPISGKNI